MLFEFSWLVVSETPHHRTANGLVQPQVFSGALGPWLLKAKVILVFMAGRPRTPHHRSTNGLVRPFVVPSFKIKIAIADETDMRLSFIDQWTEDRL